MALTCFVEETKKPKCFLTGTIKDSTTGDGGMWSKRSKVMVEWKMWLH
ncbi:hypothetical protein HanXRQr2_Chr15g0691891 [Helianthus annuus]|uniref:Uncharacterized protein n=1 Tax=Helianthus annuus TaxID=4232 RepID=A0A9K3H4E9_HELAN|nr:hypothetical protein HanXRQr2_Chr15g0691891 [Helianthus annuus]